MKCIRLSWIPILLALTCGKLVYAEPENLAFIKKDLSIYHDNGAYEQEIAQVAQQAQAYLGHRVSENLNRHHPAKLAIVLDIDETSLSNYSSMKSLDFGGTLTSIKSFERQGQDPAIIPVLKLYQAAEAEHIAVFFISGRTESERQITQTNLQHAGYSLWDGLYLRPDQHPKESVSVFKTEVRQNLEKQGYDIVLNIGDQLSDLRGGFADKNYKVPNPYYFIP